MLHLDEKFVDTVEILFYELTNYIHKQCMKYQRQVSVLHSCTRLSFSSELDDLISVKVKRSFIDDGDGRVRVFDIALTGPSEKELISVRELFQVLELTGKELIKEDFLLRELGAWPPHIFEGGDKVLRQAGSKGIKELSELIFDTQIRSLIWPNSSLLDPMTKNTQRLTQLLRHIRLSTSPFVLYPTPKILKRLETQEISNQTQRKTQTLQTGRVSRAGHRKTKSIGSISDVNSSDRFSLASLAAVDGSAANFLNSQCIQVLKVVHLEEKNPLTLGSHVLPPCVSSVINMDFGNNSTDLSLKTFLESLIEESDNDCKMCTTRGESCKFKDHCYSYVHSTTRIDFRINRLGTNVQTADSHVCIEKSCSRCKWKSFKQPMSAITLTYSFAKFIEHVMYHLAFHFSDDQSSCIHLQRRNVRYAHYNFYIDNHVITMNLVKIAPKEIEIPSNHVSITHDTNEISILRNKVVKFFDQKFNMISDTPDKKLLNFRKQLSMQEENILAAFIDMNSEYLTDFVNAKVESLEREFRHLMGVPTSPSGNTNLEINECILMALKSKPVKTIMESMHEMFSIAVSDEYWPDETASDRLTGITKLTHKWDKTMARMRKLEDTGKYDLCAILTKNGITEEAKSISNLHIQYRRSCKSYALDVTINFAAIFAILRHKYGIIEEEFATSLAQVKQWNASGGKSQVKFWKSQDGDFIIKEARLNLLRKNSFMMKYLAYLLFDRFPDSENAKCLPCLLVPILGHLDVKLVSEGITAIDAGVMIMENLFSDKQLHTQFDLKGIRGRMTDGTRYPFQFFFKRLQPERIWKRRHKKTTTLGDANFEEATNSSKNNSLYVYLHSRNLLLRALKDDIKFLAECNIVDYSLLVGVEEKEGNLIVGVVDFLCEYGLMKALESTGKRSLSMIEGAIKTMIGANDTGEGQNDVTIIPPEEYAKRMISAIETYFPAVPDRWTRLVNS